VATFPITYCESKSESQGSAPFMLNIANKKRCILNTKWF